MYNKEFVINTSFFKIICSTIFNYMWFYIIICE